MTNLSVRLRELRGASSQAEMARSIGIPQQAWARYEKGVVAPNAETLFQICRVHACSADWLLGLSSRGGSATARGDGAIAAAGSNIHIEVGKSAAAGEMAQCKRCPHLKRSRAFEKLMAK